MEMENNGSGDLASQPLQPEAVVVTPPTPSAPSTLRKVFMGPNGIRAGWRLLIYALLITALSAAIFPALMHLLHIPQNQKMTTLTPGFSLLFESLSLFVALVAAVIMRRIEREQWGHYGLPLNKAFGREFWIGVVCGFSALSLVMLCLKLMHVFTIDGFALQGAAILKFGAVWAIVFLCVGLYEEFLMRGYALYTLSSGIGFWPSAVILSIVFFAGHISNKGEDWLGLLGVFLFGMLCCLILWKTGSLWLPVGIHAAWDWGLTFFYSAPDSGLMAEGQLFHSHFSGPWWLSGGSAGPEGSVVVTVLLLISFGAIAAFAPRRKWVSQNERRLAAKPTAPPEPPPLLDSSALTR